MTIRASALAAVLALVAFGDEGNTEPLHLSAAPLSLHTEDPGILRVGRLRYQGGLRLTSSDARFGGVSGLVASADGRRLSAVTDRGDWMTLSPSLTPAGELVGISKAAIGRLFGRNGRPLRRRRDRDAESLVAVDDGFIVSFEHFHRLRSHRGGANPFVVPPTEITAPPNVGNLPANAGFEALARLRDGRLVAIAENYPEDAPYALGWFRGQSGWQSFRYERHAQFLVTGAAVSPGGDLLVLERRHSLLGGFGTRLTLIDPASILPDAMITGRELARLEAPLITENFEGLAAYSDKAGQTILYMISDDNFFALQSTILLKFILDG